MADQEESAGKAQALATVDVSVLCKRRGVLHGSVTRIDTRIQELEDNGAQPDTFARAQQLITKLETLDRDFKKLHMQVVDHLDQEEELEKKQLVLDDYDDKVSNQLLRLQQLCDAVKSPVDSPTRNLLSRKLSHLEKLLATARTTIAGIPDEDDDRILILQYEEHLKTYKSELATIYQEIIEADISEDDALCRLQYTLVLKTTYFNARIMFANSFLQRRLLPQLHLRTLAESSYRSSTFPPSMVIFLIGSSSGNSSVWLYIIVRVSLMLRS